MPVDSSIYRNRVALDPFGSALNGYGQGLRMRDMADERKLRQKQLGEKTAVEDAYKKHTTVGPGGQVSLNRETFLSDLAKNNPQLALQEQQKFATSDLDNRKNQAELYQKNLNLTSQLLGGVKDQQTYSLARSKAQGMGLDVSQFPEQYDPGLVQSARMQVLTAQEQLANQWKEKDFGLKQQELAIKRAEGLEKKQEKLVTKKEKSKEFDDRYNNIKTAVYDLRAKLKNKGTYEMFGSHEKDLATLIDSIAIDSAKMFDPQSVARESEVAAFRNMLFEPGSLGTSNSTADKILANYEKMLDKRAGVIRTGQPIMGDQSPAGLTGVDFTKMPDNDIDALYKKLGGK